MRLWTLLTFLSVLALALVGCGGAGAGGPAGVWSGGYTSVPDVNGELDFEFVVSGSTLTGFARLVTGGNVHTGTISGTYTGDLNFTVNYSGGYGLVTYSLLLSGNVIGGSYSRSGESGDVLVNFVATNTLLANGTWNGSYVASVTPPASGTMTTTFTQSGNTVSGTMTITPQGGSAVNTTVSGEVFGTNIQLRGTFGAFGAMQWEGTLSGAPPTSMSGQYVGNTGNGIFTMTLQ